MHTLIDTFIQFPVLALFLAIGVGYIVGEINFFGFRLGIAGVLFAGLAIGALHPKITVPDMLPTLGLIIFVYMIGIYSAPALVEAIKTRGYRDSLFAVAVLTFGAVITFGCAWGMKMSGPRAAGLFCGAVTNTPALAAARETVRDSSAKSGVPADRAKLMADEPVVSYSIAYPVGVIGVLLCFQIMRRVWKIKPKEAEKLTPIEVRSFLIRNPEVTGQTLGELQQQHQARFVVSRVYKHGRTDLATANTRFELGNIVAVVGDEESHEAAESLFGEPSPVSIELERSKLEYRRVVLSNKRLVGKTVGELNLDEIPATISRIRRGDTDIVASPDTRLEYGDLVRVITYRGKFEAVSKFFGDSIRHAAEADFGSVALGMVLGVLVGMIPLPLPNGTTLRLGYAGGPLIVALILGKLGRTGRISWVIPTSANFTLRQIGLLLFLAGVGIRAGWSFVTTLQSNGLPTLAAGAAVTFGITLVTLIFGYKVLKMPFDFLTGVMSGIQTQPACLAFAANQAKNDEPNVGYAGVYPAATIAKIILAQLLVTVAMAQGAETPKVRPVAAKVMRPGVNGVASITKKGGWQFAEAFSREAGATGAVTTGLVGFAQYSVTNRFAVGVSPTHWLSSRGVSGIGDTGVFAKHLLNTETRHVPLFAVQYQLKAPTARDALGTGRYDHKVTLYADKYFGPARLTGNFVTRWEGHQDRYIMQYMPSVGVLRPLYGRFGGGLQSYYSMSEVKKYGGVIAIATYHFTPDVCFHLGPEHGFGPGSPNWGIVSGIVYRIRPRQ